ncbi:MAG: SDR family oxidoreductase [Pseudomonadota bacterium]
MTGPATHGRVALITGAGGRGGIGRAIARELGSRGIDVVLTDVQRDPATLPPDEIASGWQGIDSVADELRAEGVDVLTRRCDLTEPAQIAHLVDRAVAWRGHIDILINNARALMGHDSAPVTDVPLDVWQRFLAINTTAPFLLIQHVAKHMLERGSGGRIVTIGSDMSKRARANTAAYAASKFGVFGLTQAAAHDLAHANITVNLVCPGPVRTNRFNFAESAHAEASGESLETVRERGWDNKAAGIPLGRAAAVEDVANLVGFLTSPEAAYITGQGYNINGGMFSH